MNVRLDKRWKLAALTGAALIGAVLAAAVASGDRATAVRLPAVADEMRAFDEPPLPPARSRRWFGKLRRISGGRDTARL